MRPLLVALVLLTGCGEELPRNKSCDRWHNRCLKLIPDRCGLTTSDIYVFDTAKAECAAASEALCAIEYRRCLNVARDAT